jgi:demethoxyubiquinone hydroxylase (CLK1/Coq7/Cat5 family)
MFHEAQHSPKCQDDKLGLVVSRALYQLLLYPVGLTIAGAGTALLGKEGAMACTVAVEESIANHYNNQIRTLMEEEPGKYKELLQVMDFNDGRKVEGPVSGGEGC